MAEIICDPKTGIRFGRTALFVASGNLTEQPVEALVYAANQRGIMGTGGGGTIRLLGGAEIEREAMSHAPLELGSAVVTSAGHLTKRGISAIIHAVMSSKLGDPVKPEVARRAIGAALRAADEHRIRSVAIPPPVSSLTNEVAARSASPELMIDAVITSLRRSTTRLERIILVVRFEDEVRPVIDAIARTRERIWTPPVWSR